MKNGQFVGKFPSPVTREELDKLEAIIKHSLDTYNIQLNTIKYENTYSGVIISFSVSGLDYVHRNRRGDVTTGIKHIYCYFVKENGFSSYEYLQELIEQCKKLEDNTDALSYSFYFHTDAKIKEYRKQWKTAAQLAGKNHYIYNDSLDDSLLKEEIHSYFVNLFAYKGL